MRLIDADALNWWDDLFMKGVNQSGVWVRYKDVEHFIKDAPTIDAVPVVRCQECVFWNKERVSCEGLARCLTGEPGIRYRTKDDYCSRGRRREDGEA